MNILSIPPIVMAGITSYVGVYHFLIYLRQRQHRENLTFALTCFAMGLYDVFSAGLYSVTSAVQGAQWQRAQVVTLALVSITTPWFIVDYFSHTSRISPRSKRWIAAFSVYFVIAAIVGIVDRSGLVRPLDQPAIKQIHLFWGPQITYYEMAPGPLTNLQSVFGLGVFVYILWLTVGVYRSGYRKEARPWLGALAFFFAGAVNDTAVASGLYQFVYVMEYAYLGMVLLMTYSLTNAVVEAGAVKEDLRHARQEWEEIFQAIGHPTLILDPHHRIMAANRAAARAAGNPEVELLGASCCATFHGTARPPTCCPLESILISGNLETTEMELETLGGLYLVSCTPMFDQQGKLEKIIHIATDITERKKAEAQVLRLRHLLQNITDSMPSALITLDPAGRVLTWNPAAESITGQPAARVQGQTLWQSCPQLADYRELFEQVLLDGRVAHRHKQQLASEAGQIYCDVSVFPLAANAIEGVVLRIDDVTRRVQLEEMMLQSAKMASVGGLAAGVAHEINNPLGAMMQSAQMLQLAFDPQRPRTRERLQACGVDPEGLGRYLEERGLVAYLDGIRETGKRAAKIVSDLLSFSRKSTAKARPNDLNVLVEQTLDLAAADYDLGKRYDFRDVEIVRELAPGLPQAACDGQQIQQVILNLVRNAAQAMAEEMKKRHERGDTAYRPRLTLRTAQRGEQVRLEVEDNGPGIPEAMRARLFDPFFTTKEVGEGTGLGLWLCWSIVVEYHAGRIWAEPVAGGGGRFVVELPAAHAR